MNYSTLRENTILPLFTRYGKDVRITRPGTLSGWTHRFNGGEGYDEWINGAGTVVTVDPSRVVVFNGVGVEKAYKATEIDGTTIQQGDIRILVAHTLSPQMGDWITFGDNTYKIQSVKRMSPGNTTLLWEVQCRE